MRFLVIVCVIVQFILVNSKTLPNYIPEPCKKSHPDYRGCIQTSLETVAPYLLKGIPELNVPIVDPLQVPIIKIDRTLNELISINAVLKDVKFIGLGSTVINSLKANPHDMSGEIKLSMPNLYVTMEYSVVGQLLAIPLQSRGFFRGNFTNTIQSLKGTLKLVERDGEKYFAIDNFNVKISIGNGNVKLISKNPNNQFAADLITNFFNENPRRFMEATKPIYEEAASEFYRSLFEKVLASVPAKNLLPE